VFWIRWYSSASVFIDMHRMIGAALEPERSPSASFSRLVMSKWPYMIFFMQMYRPKLSYVPLVQFVGLLCMYMGAYNAAAGFSDELSENIPVMHLTAVVNDTLRRVLEGFVQAIASVSEGLVNPGANLDSLLSPRQCLLAMWLVVQGAAFWIGFWILVRQETCNRAEFLQSLHLGPHHRPGNLAVQEMCVQLLAVQLYVAVAMLAASGPDVPSIP
jgi:hypothetical protein